MYDMNFNMAYYQYQWKSHYSDTSDIHVSRFSTYISEIPVFLIFLFNGCIQLLSIEQINESPREKNHKCNAPWKFKNILRLLFRSLALKKKKCSNKGRQLRHLIFVKTFNEHSSTLPFPSTFLLLNPFKKIYFSNFWFSNLTSKIF